jgi:hypothetical protein
VTGQRRSIPISTYQSNMLARNRVKGFVDGSRRQAILGREAAPQIAQRDLVDAQAVPGGHVNAGLRRVAPR